MAPVPISVLIITHNEELNLPDCLRSISGWASEIYVIDSFSTDRTVEIATSFGAHVVQHEFCYPAQQKNWALQNLPFHHDWLLLLDADERVPSALRDEIATKISEDAEHCAGFWMRYRLIFYGKWIRHCGWYPSWILRLVRRDRVHFEDRRVDEHAIVDGATGRLQNYLIHQSLRDLEFWIAKHNRYSTQNAQIYAAPRGTSQGVQPSLFGNQAERKRFIKEYVWPRLPGRALLFFLYMYVIRLGFLDGKHGLIFCVMHAIFQEFGVVKGWEAQNYKKGAPQGGIVATAPVFGAAASDGLAFHRALADEWEGKYRKRSFAERLHVIEEATAGSDIRGRIWLDAGCGTGTLSRWLAVRGAAVFGVDAASEMTGRAEELSRKVGDQVQFRVIETIEALPFDSSTFDGVLCSSVLEYVRQPEQCLFEFARVLRPGGILLLSAPNARSVVRRILKVVFRLTSAFGVRWPAYLAHSVHEYRINELSQLLVQYGFTPERIMTFGTALPTWLQRRHWLGTLTLFRARRAAPECQKKGAPAPAGAPSELR